MSQVDKRPPDNTHSGNWVLDDMERRTAVVIVPRVGVSASEVRKFLERTFQQPGTVDDGNNPLVNADLFVTLVRRGGR